MPDQNEQGRRGARCAAPELVRELRHVVVLGANGTMGYQSGALFAAIGVPVTFLARTREKAEAGRAGATRAVRSSAITAGIGVGSYGHDLAKALAHADLVIEAVAEAYEIKRALFEQVDHHRKPDAIVATVSSGLSITDLAAGLSDSFQRHFLGLHLFNPPQVIVGTEIIAGHNTDPAIVDFVDTYVTRRLGRLTVRAADLPGFAGNRVGFKVLNEVAQLAEIHGPLLMERLIGPYTGRSMPPLATIDLVGWDVHQAIVDNVSSKVKDEASDTYRLPAYMRTLIEGGTLGDKTGGGFFRRTNERERLALNIERHTYEPMDGIVLPELAFIDEITSLQRVGNYEQAMQCFAKAPGDAAKLAHKVVAGYISYAYCRVGEITDTIAGIDRIMAAGFNWAPPSVLVDLIGLPKTIAMIDDAGLTVPQLLKDALDRVKTGPLFKEAQLSPGRYFVAK